MQGSTGKWRDTSCLIMQVMRRKARGHGRSWITPHTIWTSCGVLDWGWSRGKVLRLRRIPAATSSAICCFSLAMARSRMKSANCSNTRLRDAAFSCAATSLDLAFEDFDVSCNNKQSPVSGTAALCRRQFLTATHLAVSGMSERLKSRSMGSYVTEWAKTLTSFFSQTSE